ncbi:MAG: hypothetical protein ACPG31_04990 [Planctomycetota bacterium]
MSKTSAFIILAVGLISVAAFADSPRLTDPSDAVTTFQVTKPKRAGKVTLKLRVLGHDLKKKSGEHIHEIPITITAGMTREGKLKAFEDALKGSYPNHGENGDWVIERGTANVTISPSSTNTDVGKIKVVKATETSRESVDFVETVDVTPSNSGPLELAPIPTEFFTTGSAPDPSWKDWIIFDFTGTPTGTIDGTGVGMIGVRANAFDIVFPTTGLSMNQILDQIALEALDYDEFVAGIDYSTSRIILVSDNLINKKGMVCLDSGVDMEFEVMPSAD